MSSESGCEGNHCWLYFASMTSKMSLTHILFLDTPPVKVGLHALSLHLWNGRSVLCLIRGYKRQCRLYLAVSRVLIMGTTHHPVWKPKQLHGTDTGAKPIQEIPSINCHPLSRGTFNSFQPSPNLQSSQLTFRQSNAILQYLLCFPDSQNSVGPMDSSWSCRGGGLGCLPETHRPTC